MDLTGRKAGDAVCPICVSSLGDERPGISWRPDAIIDCPGPGKEDWFSTLWRSGSNPVGNGCDGKCLAGDDPGDEGIPDANRAIEDCRGLPFTEGDPERISEIGTGVIDRGWRDEPSPLSGGCAIIQTPP